MSKKKRGLGRGLSALIPDEPKTEEEPKVDDKDIIKHVDISLIEPNREQPRREFKEDKLTELAESIRKHGIIQPLIVQAKGEGYELVAGERRWRAAKEAGLKEVPCITKELKHSESTEIALIENIQREDLNPIEEGVAYKSLIEKHNMTQEKVSEVVGKSRSYITNILRLLNLDERVIEYIVSGELSSGHGRTLLGIEDQVIQYKMAKLVIEKNLSVRETEKLVKQIGAGKKNKAKKNNVNHDDPILSGIEESLRNTLGTQVKIVKGKKKSKIEIEYYNDEDLDRILDIISLD